MPLAVIYRAVNVARIAAADKTYGIWPRRIHSAITVLLGASAVVLE